jgi:hypothetical protein
MEQDINDISDWINIINEDKTSDESQKQLDSETIKQESCSELIKQELCSEPIKKELDLEPIKQELDLEPIKQELDLEPIKQELCSEPIKQELCSEPIKQELDSKLIKQELDLEPIKQELDSKLIKQELDLEPIKQELDSKLIKQQLDLEPIKQELDLEPIKQKLFEDSSNIISNSLNIDSKQTTIFPKSFKQTTTNKLKKTPKPPFDLLNVKKNSNPPFLHLVPLLKGEKIKYHYTADIIYIILTNFRFMKIENNILVSEAYMKNIKKIRHVKGGIFRFDKIETLDINNTVETFGIYSSTICEIFIKLIKLEKSINKTTLNI